MSRSKLNVLRIACCVGAVLGLAACNQTNSIVEWEADGTPRHFHPNEHWWQYNFVYHPEAQVYFNPFTHTYSWYDSDNEMWFDGKRLPKEYAINVHNAQVVKVNFKPPHSQHRTITAKKAGPTFSAFPASTEEYPGQYRFTKVGTSNDH